MGKSLFFCSFLINIFRFFQDAGYLNNSYLHFYLKKVKENKKTDRQVSDLEVLDISLKY